MLLGGACAGSDDPSPTSAPVPAPSSPPAPSVTSIPEDESPSGVVSEHLQAWSALAVTDYDLEYILDGGEGSDSGLYRGVVRDGETVNCYLDGVLSMRLECDPAHFSVESIFDRIVSGDARTAEVVYDEHLHFPASVEHDRRPDLGEPYTLEVVSFTPREPIDWVAYVADAVDWLEETYSGDAPIDWSEVRAEALALVEANPRRVNAYTGLDRVTMLVRGALFRTPREVALDESQDHGASSFREAQLLAGAERTGPPPAGERIGDVGYLRLPGAFPDQRAGYVPAVDDLMAVIDAEPVCGWIVDLRDPHFVDVARDAAALGPLMGERTLLTYRLSGEQHVYSYMSGTVLLNGEPVEDAYRREGIDPAGLEVPGGPYVPAVPDAPIALLTSIESGTWPLVGFDGRPRTRVFGEPPQGGLGLFALGERPSLDLPLGAKLYAPRGGDDFAQLTHPFDSQPDELVLPIPGSGVDEVLQAALDWLSREPPCGP